MRSGAAAKLWFERIKSERMNVVKWVVESLGEDSKAKHRMVTPCITEL